MLTLSASKKYFKMLFLLIALSACDYFKDENKKLAGNINAGGTLTIAHSIIDVKTLPMQATDLQSSFVISLLYDRLFKLSDKSNKAIPYLVDNYVITNDGKKYTFELKKGVYFQDDPCYPNGRGKELSAADVKYTIELLCTQSPDNFNFEYTLQNLIVGANAFYENSTKKIEQELSGLKIIDKYKFSIEIENATTKLLHVLSSSALSIISKEAYEKYGNKNINGTGPFIMDKKFTTLKSIFVKNQNYFLKDSLGNKLPYIDSVVLIRNNDMNARFKEFKSGKADLVTSIPAKDIKTIIEEEIQFFENADEKAKFFVDFEPEYSTRVLLLNLNNEPFKNKLVRKALNYALDKDKILEIFGTGLSAGAANSSFVPPIMVKMAYNLPDNTNYKFNLALAKKYLAEAGYPDGKGLPPINLIVPQQDDGVKLALELQKQWLQNLNVKMAFEIVDFSKNIEMYINSGKYEMSDFFWIADYPSPESFLNLFYADAAKQRKNWMSYFNADYNFYFDKAIRSNQTDSMMHYFNAAENILMDDAPVIFLYYGSNFKLVNSRITQLETSPLGYYDLTRVIIKRP
jgi:oligopeptide transport system substrate-binding protein